MFINKPFSANLIPMVYTRVSKVQPAGQIRPAKPFCHAAKTIC